MWCPAIPVAIWLARWAVKEFTPRAAPKRRDWPHSQPQATSGLFAANLIRLRTALSKTQQRPVVVMGEPGSGKSSLILRLANGQCRPMPLVGQQTDATDWSQSTDVNLIIDSPAGQFVDLPGLDTERHPLRTALSLFPFDLVEGVLLVQKGKLWGTTELLIAHVREKVARGVLRADFVRVVRTFSDAIEPNEAKEALGDLQMRTGGQFPVFLVSNRTQVGVEQLRVALLG
jgi:hypothetical protein